MSNKRKPPRDGGFTLVEIIVVLVILALLAAVLIPSLTGYIDKAAKRREITACRQAVEAAQTLASERYALSTLSAKPPEAGEIKTLAEVPGTVSDVKLAPSGGAVVHLTYHDRYFVTYCRNFETCDDHDEMYTINEVAGWEDGTTYNKGDKILIDGYTFEYINNTPTNNHNPSIQSEKNYWKVIAIDDGSNNSYSSMYRYAEGVIVKYTSSSDRIARIYKRTSYNIGSDQTPFDGSRYWTLIT